MSARTSPPFRADHVGSLLRPAPLKDARAKHAKGEIDAAALKAVEDREIEKIVKKQEEIGLKLATDGEFRRTWWHFDFFRGLEGVTPITTDTGIKFHGVETKHEAIAHRRQGQLRRPSAYRPFQVLATALPRHAEDDDSGARHVAFPARPRMVSKQVYPDYRRLFRRPRPRLARGVQAFYAAGCRYLQLDDTAWAMMCDPKEREGFEVARRRSRQVAGDLCARHPRGAGRQAGRHGDHHAFLPRQFPLDLDRRGRL